MQLLCVYKKSLQASQFQEAVKRTNSLNWINKNAKLVVEIMLLFCSFWIIKEWSYTGSFVSVRPDALLVVELCCILTEKLHWV